MSDWAKQLDKALHKAQEQSTKAVGFAVLALQRDVAVGYGSATGTPIDTGLAMSNWIVGINQNRHTTTSDKSGRNLSDAAARVNRKLSGVRFYSLQNNLPYIHILEYGLYPNPPKLGSWDKKRGHYVIKSVNGFSKQAPQGMLRIALNRFDAHLRTAARTIERRA